jgi:hypothetical protein
MRYFPEGIGAGTQHYWQPRNYYAWPEYHPQVTANVFSQAISGVYSSRYVVSTILLQFASCYPVVRPHCFFAHHCAFFTVGIHYAATSGSPFFIAQYAPRSVEPLRRSITPDCAWQTAPLPGHFSSICLFTEHRGIRAVNVLPCFLKIKYSTCLIKGSVLFL